MSDCLMINDSGCVIEMVAWPDYTHNALNPYCGVDFSSVIQAGAQVPNGTQQVVAQISDTGHASGWLYFDLLKADGTRLHLQAFIRNRSGVLDSPLVGFYDSSSKVHNPIPLNANGSLGQTSVSSGSAIFTLTSNVASLSNPVQTFRTNNHDPLLGTKGVNFYAAVSHPTAQVFVRALDNTDWFYGAAADGSLMHSYNHYEMSSTGADQMFAFVGCDADQRYGFQYANITASDGNLDNGSSMSDITRQNSLIGSDYVMSYGFQDAGTNERDQAYVYLTKPHTAWMGDLVKSNPEIGEMPFTVFALPGAHDAGMFTSIDARIVAAIKTAEYGGVSVLALVPVVGLLFNLATNALNVSYGLVSIANTQKDDTATQLLLGTRFFDFRPGYCVYDPTQTGELHHQHAIVPGYKYHDFLKAVLSFLVSNLTEIVVVRLKNDGFLCDFMTPSPQQLADALSKAVAAVPGASAIQVGSPLDLGRNVNDLLTSNTRLIMSVYMPVDITSPPSDWNFTAGVGGGGTLLDSYTLSPNCYSTTDPNQVIQALSTLQATAATSSCAAIYQLQDTASDALLSDVDSFITESQCSSLVLSTKAQFDATTYPYLPGVNYENQGLVVLLNDFVDSVLTEIAISATSQRVSAAASPGHLFSFAQANGAWTAWPLPTPSTTQRVAISSTKDALSILELSVPDGPGSQSYLMINYKPSQQSWEYDNFSASTGTGPVAGNPILLSINGGNEIYVQMGGTIAGHLGRFYYAQVPDTQQWQWYFEDISAQQAVNLSIQGDPAVFADDQGNISVFVQQALTGCLIQLYKYANSVDWVVAQNCSTQIPGCDLVGGSPIVGQSPASDIYVPMAGSIPNHLGRVYYGQDPNTQQWQWLFEDVSSSQLITEALCVMADNSGNQNVFAKDSNNAIHQFSLPQGGIWKVNPVSSTTGGQTISGGLALVVTNSGSLQLFGRDPNGNLLQFIGPDSWQCVNVSNQTHQLIATDPAVWTDGTTVYVYAVTAAAVAVPGVVETLAAGA